MSGMYKCTVIKGRVMEELKFGFNSHDIPVPLVNNTSPNDTCASFYFRQDGEYYLLWVEHQNVEYRESDDLPRYAISCAINEGDDENPEIYSDTSKNDIFRSDDVKDLIAYFHSYVSFSILVSREIWKTSNNRVA